MVCKTIKRQRTRQKKRQKKRQRKIYIGGGSDSELITLLKNTNQQGNKNMLKTIPNILKENNTKPNIDFTCKMKFDDLICNPNNESALDKIREIGMEGLTEESIDKAIELITEHIAKIPGISHIALLPKLYTVAKKAYKESNDIKKLTQTYNALKKSGLSSQCQPDDKDCITAASVIIDQMEDEFTKDITEWKLALATAGQVGTATEEQAKKANCEIDLGKKWDGETCLSPSKWTKKQCDKSKKWDSTNAEVTWPPPADIGEEEALINFNKLCVTSAVMNSINEQNKKNTNETTRSIFGVNISSKKPSPSTTISHSQGSPFGGKKKRKTRRKTRRKTKRKTRRKKR